MTAEQLLVLVGLTIVMIGRAIKQLLEKAADERQRAGGPSQARLEPPALDRGPKRSEPVRAPARPAPPSDAHVFERRAASPARRMLRRDLNNPKRAMLLLAVFGPPRAETLAAPRARGPRLPRPR